MIVADTNIITYLLITGEKTDLARQVYQQDGKWSLPELWQHEFANVLATYVKNKIVTLEAAQLAWQNSHNLFSAQTFGVDFEAVLQVAIDEAISAYDAQFVVLAQSLSCLLVTEDKRLQAKFPDVAVSMSTFLEKRGGD